MIGKLFSSSLYLDKWLVILRAITVIIIMVYGLEVFSKKYMEGNTAWLKDIQFPLPLFMAYVGKTTELLGGISLIPGLFTRTISILLVINMSFITFIMGNAKIPGEEILSFLLLLLFAAFFFAGSGKWSLDCRNKMLRARCCPILRCRKRLKMRALLVIFFLTLTFVSFSQTIFPSLSPKGRIEQKIGLTNISVDYERPAARGRKVFGELVKYDKLWRTGAGNCTKIGFSEAVVIGNKSISKGTYSIFTIPGTSEWALILNKDTTLYGLTSYDATKDIIRLKVKAHSTDRYYESLTIDIDIVPNNAIVYLSWENTQISFQVKTESDKLANDFIQQYLLTDKSRNSDEYAAAAEYYYYLNKDLDRAVLLIDKAIAMKEESWYYRQKVDILEMQKKYEEAIDCATLAISIDQKRTNWDSRTKQQSETEYKKRIEFFKRQKNKINH